MGVVVPGTETDEKSPLPPKGDISADQIDDIGRLFDPIFDRPKIFQGHRRLLLSPRDLVGWPPTGSPPCFPRTFSAGS